MSSFSRVQRPEAVLQRAEEFIAVGKDNDALNVLHEFIRDRRHKQWSQTHEHIMLRHLELCVKLRNAAMAKDALYQYKSLTQQVAVSSLENVMKHLLKMAENKAETAQKESIEKIEEIDDLDSSDAPEALLLSVVSGAVSQDRMDRTVLSPWLRFLWDSYRNCLDLLRNNNLVETLYHQTARQSFAFCIKYQRRNEFRKLCDLLRLHLTQLQKNVHSHNANNQRINLAESLSVMQETRLIQLDTAIQMELWQEAYKSSEDLHNLMQLGKEKDKRAIKPQSFVNYYDKLSLIFWKGGNFLFHSAALLQKFTIYKDMKKTFSGEEATEQATRLLLAALSISDDFDTSSILTKHLDMEDMHLNNVRVLSTLLRLPVAPTRKGILREIAHLSVPDISQESVRRLYRLMEVDFAPLEAAKLVDAELEKIKSLGREDYSQYVECIRAVVATKILKGLTNIYDAMPIDRMAAIIPFYNRSELEHFLVHITKQRFLKAQVDHREKCIRFGPIDATISGDVEAEFGENAAYKSEYETMRVHLTRLYNLLSDTAYAFDEDAIRARAIEQFSRHRQTYEYHKDSDHERIMQRKKIIEHHKENNENLKQAKLMEAQKITHDKEEKRRKEELERLKREQEESDKKRRQAEQEEVQKKIRLEQIKRFQSNPIYSQIVKEKGEEALQNMDPENVLREQRERMDAERREQTIRMLQQERKYDYFVRAFNIEEREIAKQLSEERRRKAPTLFEECEERRIEQAKKDRKREVDTFTHLDAAKADAINFIRGVVSSHKEDLERKKAEFEKRLAQLKTKKLEERKLAREKDRRRKYEQAKKEEKEAKEQEILREKEAEREERQAAIQASRGRGREQRGDFHDHRRDEAVPDSKADTDSEWRRGGPNTSVQRRPPPAARPVLIPAVIAAGHPEIGGEPSAAEQTKNWRGENGPSATHALHEPTRQPFTPRAPPPVVEADTASTWRRPEAAKPSVPPPQPQPAPVQITASPAPATRPPGPHKYQAPRGNAGTIPTTGSGPGKFVPSRAAAENAPDRSKAPGHGSRPSDGGRFSNLNSNQGPRRDGNQPGGPQRTQRNPPGQRTTRPQNNGASGADSGSWR